MNLIIVPSKNEILLFNFCNIPSPQLHQEMCFLNLMNNDVSRMLEESHRTWFFFLCVSTTALSFATYHPAKGYSWNFKDQEDQQQASIKPKTKKKKEEPASAFQYSRVDGILSGLVRKFPPKYAKVRIRTLIIHTYNLD